MRRLALGRAVRALPCACRPRGDRARLDLRRQSGSARRSATGCPSRTTCVIAFSCEPDGQAHDDRRSRSTRRSSIPAARRPSGSRREREPRPDRRCDRERERRHGEHRGQRRAEPAAVRAAQSRAGADHRGRRRKGNDAARRRRGAHSGIREALLRADAERDYARFTVPICSRPSASNTLVTMPFASRPAFAYMAFGES